MAIAVLPVSGYTQAADPAVIEVQDEPGAEVLPFQRDVMLFTDRSYRLAKCPARLKGKNFLASSIDDTTGFEVVQSGRLMVLTPQPIDQAASQVERLEELGFSQADEDLFQLFGEAAIDRVLLYEKEVSQGDSYEFDKWVVVMGFKDARGAIHRAGAARAKPFCVHPPDIPNTGILFVDQEKDDRSGHGGIALTECKNGDILSFYSATCADSWGGHSVSGWSKYRRSTDGGRSWGEPVDFDYSREIWEEDEVYSALVFSVITAPDGTLVATLMRYANARWGKQKAPVYFLSHDEGHTWDGPHLFCEEADVDDISMTLSTDFVHDGEIFIVFRGGRGNMRGDPHTLWVSDDNGESFHKRSKLPFRENDYYWAAGVLDDDAIIVYTYRAHHHEDRGQEKNIPYTISRDGGRTWSSEKKAHFAKGIRNPQFAGEMGGYYFMHGRSGSYGHREGDDPGPGNFVLYSSQNGVQWDEGIVLMSRMLTPGGGDCYSSNEIIGKYDSGTPNRLLIQADISYDGARTNMHHWWVSLAPMQKD